LPGTAKKRFESVEYKIITSGMKIEAIQTFDESFGIIKSSFDPENLICRTVLSGQFDPSPISIMIDLPSNLTS
jgi:hypothetical protein